MNVTERHLKMVIGLAGRCHCDKLKLTISLCLIGFYSEA